MKRQNKNRPSVSRPDVVRGNRRLNQAVCLFCVVVHLFWLVKACFYCVRFCFSILSQEPVWGMSPNWLILCRMRRKTLTESISALTLMFGWQEEHLAGKNGAPQVLFWNTGRKNSMANPSVCVCDNVGCTVSSFAVCDMLCRDVLLWSERYGAWRRCFQFRRCIVTVTVSIRWWSMEIFCWVVLMTQRSRYCIHEADTVVSFIVVHYGRPA